MIRDLERLRSIGMRRRSIHYLLKHSDEDPDELRTELSSLEEHRRKIIRSFDDLPPKDRELLLLYYDAGLTWDQVAAALETDKRHVYRLRRRILDRRTACTSDSEGRSAAD